MIPFIIAGAIGFGVAKLVENSNTSKYADGGEASELNVGQIFEINRNSEKAKKYFDNNLGKGYIFIISDIFNQNVKDSNQFWDSHIKLKVYDSNLRYIYPIRVFFKGKPFGLNLTEKLFLKLLNDKTFFLSENYYVEKESDYDREKREWKGDGYVELIKRKINPIWQSIVDKFNDIYYLVKINYESNDISSSEVKARGSNPYSSYEFRNFSPLLSWKEAEDKFKYSLTKEQLDSINISYEKDEYADLEEHDTERYVKTIIVSKKENNNQSKSALYNQLIEGYELSLEIETDKQKIKMYRDLIEGYKLALELE